MVKSLSVLEKNVGPSPLPDLLTSMPKNSTWKRRNYKANSGETGSLMPKPKNGKPIILPMKVNN